MTTVVLEVPQENLSHKAFDEEFKAPMVDNSAIEEPVFLATPQHQPPADPGVPDVQCSTCTRTKISSRVTSSDGKSYKTNATIVHETPMVAHPDQHFDQQYALISHHIITQISIKAVMKQCKV